MRILVAAATTAELAPLAGRLGTAIGSRRIVVHEYRHHEVHLLVTGIGMVATAARCATALTGTDYALALNVGLCGSFDPAFAPGAVVHVVVDRIAELGAEDGDQFLTLSELGLEDPDDPAPTGGTLINTSPPENAVLGSLPHVTAITVNTVHGHERTIAAATERFHPQVESMEGAAFMYCCRLRAVPFAQVRAVSNVVERRNRASWRIAEAIEALAATAQAIVDAS